MSSSLPLPQPPGGMLTCPNGYTPIVRVKNGEIYASCLKQSPRITILRNGDYTLPVKNWILAEITGRPRSREQVLTASEESIIDNEQYEYFDPDDGDLVAVYFSLPERRLKTVY